MRWWISWLIERRTVVWIAHVLVLLVASLGLPRLWIDNSPEAFFVDDAHELERYREYRLLFGRDQTVQMVIEGDAVWTSEGLDWLGGLERDVEALFGVVGTAGLYSHHRWRWAEWPPVQPEVLRAEVMTDPLDRAAGWVHPESGIVTVMVLLYDLAPAQRADVLRRIREMTRGAPGGIEVTVVGLPVIAEALDDAVLDVSVETFPLVVGSSVVLLWILLRSPRAIAVILLLVGFVETTVFGAMGWQGHPLDMVQIVLAPIVFVVTVANALYLVIEFRYRLREAGSGSALEALIATYRERSWAVLWTGVTTVAGFGSLSLSESPPIRALGLWCAFGLFVTTVETFVLLPTLLWLSRRRGKAAARGASSLPLDARLRWVGRRLGEWTLAHRRLVAGVFVALSVIAVAGMVRLEVGAGLLEYFEPEAPVRRDIERLEHVGVDVGAADLVLQRPSDPETSIVQAASATGIDFARPDALGSLADLASRLRMIPGVSGVLSPADLVAAGARLDNARDEAGAAVEVPGAQRVLEGERSPDPPVEELRDSDWCSGLALLSSIPDTEALLRSALRSDGAAARVHLRIPIRPLDDLAPLFTAAVEEGKRSFPAADVWVTGIYPLVLQGQRSLLRTMVVSLTLTLLVVLGIFALLVRRLRTLVAMTLPNLWPVLFVLGAMGWAGIALDSTTLMIAAVVLSLSVDDTLHSLGAFRRRAPTLGALEGAIETLEHTAAGHVSTSLVLILGFALCGLSGFVPVANFGVLVAAGVAAALAADLTLVPVLLASLSEGDVAALEHAGPSS